MSFTIVEQATARLNRSELAVPGSNPALFEKAAASAADVVFLDLEDAVAPDDKVRARKNIIQALNDIDWGSKTMSVRINGLDTHYMYRDVVDIIERRLRRRHAGHPVRGRGRTQEADRLRAHHRDRARHGQRR
jgi:malyl-CoA/(S)-citramalyl-CoA lyase